MLAECSPARLVPSGELGACSCSSAALEKQIPTSEAEPFHSEQFWGRDVVQLRALETLGLPVDRQLPEQLHKLLL